MADIAPGDRAVHVVDPSLLDDARRRGEVDDDLRARTAAHLAALTDRGAVAVVCTCSTIGAAAEEVGRHLGLDVIRVDRPMALQAVAMRRIAIVAALESTLGPTRALLEEAARTTGNAVTITDAPCLDAWAHFEAGDTEAYLARLASHVESLDGSFDVIVLAQASMATVASMVTVSALVLSSPRSAVSDLVIRTQPTAGS